MRVVTKIGDVFSVKISDTEKKYIQLISFDLTELNSDVIRSFREVYPFDSNPEISKVIKGDVDFYTHCVTKVGVKLSYWDKVGNINDVGNIDNIIFRSSGDYGRYPRRKIISEDWYIWKINEKRISVGKLTGIYRIAEIGGVNPPDLVVHRMKTGDLGFSYPDFE